MADQARIRYREVSDILRSMADASKAQKSKAYLRDQFEFYGIQTKPLREATAGWLASCKSLDQNDVIKLVGYLWDDAHRECQHVAMDLMSKHVKRVDASFLDVLERCILHKSWWDTVDWLAPHGCATLFRRFPETRDSYVFRWIESSDIWLRRSAIIFQNFYREKTDFELLSDFILRQVHEKEFFVQKACGWALRQYSKTEGEAVRRFIDQHPELSGLCKREALKWLSRGK